MRPAKSLSAVALVALTFAFGRAAFAIDPSPAPSPAAEASPAVGSTTAPKTAMVDTLHFAYDPDPLTVAVGTRVTFKNSDGVAHTVTSADGGDKPAFDSGDMPQNATWSHVFTKAGTYKYVCRYHAYMKGTITVK